MKIKIRTKFQGATNSSGSKVIATGMGKQKGMPYRHELSVRDNHETSAREFCEKHGLPVDTFAFEAYLEKGYCFSISVG